MPAQQRQKVGNRHKGHRSVHKKGYYTSLVHVNEMKNLRRAKDRQKRQRDYADGTRVRTKAQERLYRATR